MKNIFLREDSPILFANSERMVFSEVQIVIFDCRLYGGIINIFLNIETTIIYGKCNQIG